MKVQTFLAHSDSLSCLRERNRRKENWSFFSFFLFFLRYFSPSDYDVARLVRRSGDMETTDEDQILNILDGKDTGELECAFLNS